jgi:putative spermidine/putrescine transport system permease protein
MARYAGGAMKAALYLAVMLPLWSSYLVRLYAWKLLLAKEGAISWVLAELHLGWVLEGLLALPVIGGHSLSFSPLGTFIVFVYLWLPFMILPIQAALERVPASLVEASGDLGAQPATTFWRVVFPLAVPGIAAGSIFTFSLTLGDYIVPGVIGDSSMFIGQVVSLQQGTAGNVPAAALSFVRRGDRALPVGSETAGGFRCALAAAVRRRQSGCAPRPGRWSPSCTCRSP